MLRSLLLAVPTLSIGALMACGTLQDAPGWWDTLQADSPCYRVNLLDGLDASSTAEVDDLFACVNHHGHIEPMMPLVGDALHHDSRTGDPAAIELARAVNGMADLDVDIFALVGILGEALKDPDRPVDEIVDLLLELTYGDRANRVRAGSIALTSTTDLERGVLVPLAPVVPKAARALLDDPTDTAGWVGSWLSANETKRWIRTIQSWMASSDPQIERPMDELVHHLGTLLEATRNPDNDEWSGASGDSLRDVLDAYYLRDVQPVLGQIAPEAAILLTDSTLRASLEPALVDLHADGNLGKVPFQLVWMTTVDANGGARTVGEDSALEAFVRLLARANGPADCLGIYTTDNLAVDVLSLLADLDPDTSLVGLDVVAWITGNSITDWLLEEAVDLGVCDGIDRGILNDLDAVSVITKPEAYDVFVTFVRILEVLKSNASEDRLPVMADLVARLYEAGGYAPVEEVVRDVGLQPALGDLVALVPVLADPAAYGITAGHAPAVDLTDAIDLLEWVFATDPALDLAGWERVRPLALPLLTEDGTWDAMGHAARLMADDKTQTSQMLDLLPTILDLDPELALLDQVGPLLGDPVLRGPVLRLLETPEVSAALLASRPDEGQTEVPLAFVSRLLVDGTFDDLMRIVDLLLGNDG